jgi:AcrR family transcriptional regulator
MSRYTKQHKTETRERILAMSGQRFKQDGIVASGVATLMADAGLTNGAFYAHFESKEDLVAKVLVSELEKQAATFEMLPAGTEGIQQFVTEYASVEHRDNPGAGCPSASLLAEIARCGPAARDAYTSSLLQMIDDLGHRITPKDPVASRVSLLTILGFLAGALQLSRAISHEETSVAVLENARTHALQMLEKEIALRA